MTTWLPLKRDHIVDVPLTNGNYDISIDLNIDAITPQWTELESRGMLTPFQTQAWLLPWYRIVAPAFGISPIFITVRDRSCGGPLMLIPLCMIKRNGAVIMEFPDCGVSDYNAPLLSSNFNMSDDVFAELWELVLRSLPKIDMINFQKMPEAIGERLNPMVRLSGSKRMKMRSWGIELPRTRKEYERSLAPRVRKELRRKRRNLEDEGQVRLLRARSVSQGRELFEALRLQRRARWRSDILTNETFLRFYEAVIFANWIEGFGALSALMVGEEVAATLFALCHRGHYDLLLHCFDQKRWGHKSPGIVAIDSAVTDQIESGGTYFDLTIGNESYKMELGVHEKFLYCLESGFSPMGFAHIAMREVQRLGEDQIRRLPKQWLRFLKTAYHHRS